MMGVQRVGQLEHHTEFISSLAFAPKGNRLASGSRDGSVETMDMVSIGIQIKLQILPGVKIAENLQPPIHKAM